MPSGLLPTVRESWMITFPFLTKLEGCSSDYLPSVVYSSSIAEESSRSGGERAHF